eukprot:1213156-Ditylum_brightwellii.AAC.1
MAKLLNRTKMPAYDQLYEMKETAKRQPRQKVRGIWEKEKLWRKAHAIAVGKFQEVRYPLMILISIPCAA